MYRWIYQGFAGPGPVGRRGFLVWRGCSRFGGRYIGRALVLAGHLGLVGGGWGAGRYEVFIS